MSRYRCNYDQAGGKPDAVNTGMLRLSADIQKAAILRLYLGPRRSRAAARSACPRRFTRTVDKRRRGATFTRVHLWSWIPDGWKTRRRFT